MRIDGTNAARRGDSDRIELQHQPKPPGTAAGTERYFSGGYDCKLLWRKLDGQIAHAGGIRSLEFSPDGKTLAAGGIGSIDNIDHLDRPARVELFDTHRGQSLHVFSGDAQGLVEQLKFHPQGKWLLAFGGDNAGFCQLYD